MNAKCLSEIENTNLTKNIVMAASVTMNSTLDNEGVLDPLLKFIFKNWDVTQFIILLIIEELPRVTIYLHNFLGSFMKKQTSGTPSDNEGQQVTTSGTTSDNEWQRVTTNSNKWYNEWQRVTTNDNKWQRVIISANFSFFQIREKPTTKHPKENSLNIKEDHEKRSIELWVETSS